MWGSNFAQCQGKTIRNKKEKKNYNSANELLFIKHLWKGGVSLKDAMAASPSLPVNPAEKQGIVGREDCAPIPLRLHGRWNRLDFPAHSWSSAKVMDEGGFSFFFLIYFAPYVFLWHFQSFFFFFFFTALCLWNTANFGEEHPIAPCTHRHHLDSFWKGDSSFFFLFFLKESNTRFF